MMIKAKNLANRSDVQLIQLKACILEILSKALVVYPLHKFVKSKTDFTLLPELLVYLYHHYADPLTLQEMANFCGFTKTHFCRWFKRNTSESPFQYLNRIRLEQAYRLLKQTNLPLLDIALCCGFESLTYFDTKFKNYYGYTPSAIRKQSIEKIQ